MHSDLLFSMLVVGLEKYARADARYPFPAELQHAMNGLALMMGAHYPKTRRQFLELMNAPLSEWWIPHGGEEIEGFDHRFALMYGDELSDPAEDFIIDGKLRVASIADLLIVKDNSLMRRFLEQKREAYQLALNDEDAAQIEAEYAVVRAFVTENAYTDPQMIRRQLPYQLQDTVREMYVPATQQHSRLLFEDSYWHCSQCGVVGVDHEKRRQGIKPDVCDVRCPGKADWEALADNMNLLVLRTGIQRRTLIPGKLELNLYHWLEDEVRVQKPQLIEVRLYPGVDRYDIRLLFADGEAWAVDVKDYRRATELGAHIAPHPEPYKADPRLHWDRAFYVVADDRDKGDYCKTAYSEAGLFHYETIQLLPEKKFRHEVENKIWELEE